MFRVPATPDPSGNTVIIEPRDYDRIIQSTRFLNMEDRKQLEKARKAREEANMEASLGRKKQMQEFEFLRKKNEKPSDLEQVSGVGACWEGNLDNWVELDDGMVRTLESKLSLGSY